MFQKQGGMGKRNHSGSWGNPSPAVGHANPRSKNHRGEEAFRLWISDNGRDIVCFAERLETSVVARVIDVASWLSQQSTFISVEAESLPRNGIADIVIPRVLRLDLPCLSQHLCETRNCFPISLRYHNVFESSNTA